MNDKSDLDSEFITKLYFDATQTIRHYDSERASFSRIAVTILSILLAFSASLLEGGASTQVLLLVFFALLSFSMIAFLVCVRISRLINYQRTRANIFLSKLNSEFMVLEKEAKSRANKKDRYFNISLYMLWNSIFVLFMVLGLIGVVLLLAN